MFIWLLLSLLSYFFTFLMFGLGLNVPRYVYAYTPPMNISHSQISLFSHSKNNNVDTNEGLSTVDRLAIPSCQNLLSFRPTTMYCIDSNDSNNCMNIVMILSLLFYSQHIIIFFAHIPMCSFSSCIIEDTWHIHLTNITSHQKRWRSINGLFMLLSIKYFRRKIIEMKQ